MRKGYRVLFAVGGTGGHLFPAQALANELKIQDPTMEVFFGGGRLGSNPFFDKLKFPFREIRAGSPFRSNLVKAFIQLLIGVKESFTLCSEYQPNLIIGFGSFYCFPILLVAKLKNIPYILVESNAHPGKVNRLFSPGALFTALQFEEAAKKLKGKCKAVKMPFWGHEEKNAALAQPEARKFFGLQPDLFTLLVFGGSQGAAVINQAMLKIEGTFQVLHFCGKNQSAEAIAKSYQSRKIPCYVKPFEDQMRTAWRAADLVISRAGGATLAELLEYEVPGILIPWPGATEAHQQKNAIIFEEFGGALLLEQEEIAALPDKIKEAKQMLITMREKLQKRKTTQEQPLCTVVCEYLKELS